MRLVEQWPPCPRGHPYRADYVVIGWEPCLCSPGHTGHRAYWCREGDVVQLVPECRRGRSDSARGMDTDVVIVDGQPHPAILGHEDMGEEWAPELLDAALTGAGWVRTGNWDTASRSATVTRA